MAVDKPKSNTILIKEFFEMSAKEAMAAAKTLTDKDKEQLGDGIRTAKLTY